MIHINRPFKVFIVVLAGGVAIAAAREYLWRLGYVGYMQPAPIAVISHNVTHVISPRYDIYLNGEYEIGPKNGSTSLRRRHDFIYVGSDIRIEVDTMPMERGAKIEEEFGVDVIDKSGFNALASNNMTIIDGRRVEQGLHSLILMKGTTYMLLLSISGVSHNEERAFLKEKVIRVQAK